MKAYVLPTEGLRVRREPSINSAIYRTLKYRETIDVVEIKNDWVQVIHPTLELWVHGRYLGRDDPKVPFISPISASRRHIHTDAGGWPPETRECNVVRDNHIDSVFIPTYQPNLAGVMIERFQQAGVKHFVLRAVTPYVPKKGDDWARLAIPAIRPFTNILGTKVMLQIHNEPNLNSEGLPNWVNGTGFNRWFIAAHRVLTAAFPGIKIGFSPLSPGGIIPNERYDERRFIAQCAPAIALSDWVATHCYYVQTDAGDLNIPIKWWKSFAQEKPILCTEAGPAIGRQVTVAGASAMFKAFAKVNVPAFAWILNGRGNAGFEGQSWVKHSIILPAYG